MPEPKAIERVKVTLGDGVERTLRYTVAAMKEARDEFGGSITSMEILKTIDETRIGKLLWYGLRADQPEITPEQIDNLVEPPLMPHIMGQYWAAMNASTPKNEQGPDVIAEMKAMMDRAEAILREAKEMRSTGLLSGASDATTLGYQNGSSGTAHLPSSPLSPSDTINGSPGTISSPQE